MRQRLNRRPARPATARRRPVEQLEARRLMYAIGDFVWEDTDCDGVQDNGEAGVADVRVGLYDGSGALVATTTTDLSGAYLFRSLELGTYEVRFTAPDGYHFSPANQGGDDELDSDANAAGSTGPIVLQVDKLFNLEWDAGLCADEPPPLPPHLEGRMTGGGSVFLGAGMVGGPVGTRVTHGFQLHCTTEANNRLEINWGKPNSHFHLGELTEVECEDTAIIQNPPDAPIDTMRATGTGTFTGTFNGVRHAKAPATVELVFRDGGPTRGEPGIYDVASYKVTVNAGNVVVLNTDGNDAGDTPDELLLQFGNHQAHYELKRLTSTASTLQQEINSVFAQLDSGTLSEAKALSLTQQLLQLQAQFEAANV